MTSFGIFVALDDVYVEGLVHISELGNDYFHFDAARHQLLGDRTRRRSGSATGCACSSCASISSSARIDFVLAERWRACFIHGFHAVLARLRADPDSVLEIYVDETRHDARMRDRS